ncbi:hypothetical protein HYV84_00220 [Candidatus Woesearchaeota archaeon]|nr:hypothetical protein [Candidatus Woesearchaeota archaeon]
MVNTTSKILKESFRGIFHDDGGTTGDARQGTLSREALNRFHQAFSQEYAAPGLGVPKTIGLDFLRSKLTSVELGCRIISLEDELEKSYVFVPVNADGRITLSAQEICSVERIPSPFITLLTDGRVVTGDNYLDGVVSGYHQLYEYQESLRTNFERGQELGRHVSKVEERISDLEGVIDAPFVLPKSLFGKPASGDVVNHLRGSYERAKHEKLKEMGNLVVDLGKSQKELASIANYLLPATIEEKVGSILTGTAAKPLALEDISIFRGTVLDYGRGLYLPAEISPGGNGSRAKTGLYPLAKGGRGSKIPRIIGYGVTAAVVLSGIIYFVGNLGNRAGPFPSRSSSPRDASPRYPSVPFIPGRDTIPAQPGIPAESSEGASSGGLPVENKRAILKLFAEGLFKLGDPYNFRAGFESQGEVAAGSTYNIKDIGKVVFQYFDWERRIFSFKGEGGITRDVPLAGTIGNINGHRVAFRAFPRGEPSGGDFFYWLKVDLTDRIIENSSISGDWVYVSFVPGFYEEVQKYIKPPVRILVPSTGKIYQQGDTLALPLDLIKGSLERKLEVTPFGNPTPFAIKHGISVSPLEISIDLRDVAMVPFGIPVP